MSSSANLLYEKFDHATTISLPVGGTLGLSDNFEVSGGFEIVSQKSELDESATNAAANSGNNQFNPNDFNFTSLQAGKTNASMLAFSSQNRATGLGSLVIGGKFRIPLPTQGAITPDIAFGTDLMYGPLSKKLGAKGFDADLKGMITLPLTRQFLLNGSLGMHYTGKRTVDLGGGYKADSKSDTVAFVNGGAGYSFTRELMGVAEIGINQFAKKNGVFAVGVKGNKDQVGFQALIGIGIGKAAPDFILGGGAHIRFSLNR